jgi:hypothetical protein
MEKSRRARYTHEFKLEALRMDEGWGLYKLQSK